MADYDHEAIATFYDLDHMRQEQQAELLAAQALLQDQLGATRIE